MTLHRLIFVATLVAVAGLMAQTPVVTPGGIVNAASYANPELPNGSIAQGSMFIIFGQNLGPANLVQATSFPLPTSAGLAGTRVRINAPAQQGGTQATDCIMVYVSATQVAAILPSSVNPGAASLEVVVGSAVSDRRPVRVVGSSFGTFTLNQGGSGPAIAQNFNSESDQPINSVLNPARPGQTMILWGTGVGPTRGDEAGGVLPGDLTSINAEVWVGSQRATLRYRGRSGCCAGVDQIVFDVPQGVEGCFVPLAVRIGNTVSNYSTISVAPPGRRCTTPLGFSDADLDRANSQGSLRFGSVLLQRSSISLGSVGGFSIPDQISDTGSADFTRYDANQLIRSTGNQPPVNLGSCTVFAATQEQTGFVDPVRAVGLDAGASISLSGPGGARTLTRQGNRPGSYFATLSTASSNPLSPGTPYLNPGTYTFNNGGGGSGADAVGAFNFSITMPAPLNWTNREQVNNINRNSGQDVTWSGGDASGITNIFGFGLSSTNANAVGVAFICLERTSAGRFTIPPVVLLSLPPSPTGGGLGSFGGLLGVGATSNATRFTAPGLDVGVVSASSTSIKTVSYQ